MASCPSRRGCKHHKRCTRPTLPLYRQTTLSFQSGQLSLCKPRPIRCTPAPHVVRRIANEAVFSTSDSTRTSFLRFPTELRIEIYRLLLLHDDVIQYHICPVQLRLVHRQATWPVEKPRWIRHGIFPSILRCCRRISEEGRDVLYGENVFTFEQKNYVCSEVVGSWELPKRNLDAVRRVLLRPYRWCFERERKLVEGLEWLRVFERLKEVWVEFNFLGSGQYKNYSFVGGVWREEFAWDKRNEEWKDFLVEVPGWLDEVRKLMFVFMMPDAGYEVLPYTEEYCEGLYRPVLEEFGDRICKGRKVIWGFEGCTDGVTKRYRHATAQGTIVRLVRM